MKYDPGCETNEHEAGYSLSPKASVGCAPANSCRMKVEGTGVLKVKPDIAIISVGVSTEDKQLQKAQEENSRKMAAILQSLTQLSIPARDIQTQTYSIEPQYDFIEGKQVFRSYKVLHLLGVTVRDVSKVGAVVDTAVANGANIVNSIRFSTADPAPYYRQALQSAVEDAVRKAAAIGQRLGIRMWLTPVRVWEVSIPTVSPMQAMMLTAPQVSTPIQAGQIEVTARVEAEFAYMWLPGR